MGTSIAIFVTGAATGLGVSALFKARRAYAYSELLSGVRDLLIARKLPSEIIAFIDRHAPEVRAD